MDAWWFICVYLNWVINEFLVPKHHLLQCYLIVNLAPRKTMSKLVQNRPTIGRAHLKPKHPKLRSKPEPDIYTVSGTSAWSALSVTGHEPHSARGPNNPRKYITGSTTDLQHWRSVGNQIARTPHNGDIAAEGSELKYWGLNKIPYILNAFSLMVIFSNRICSTESLHGSLFLCQHWFR